MGRSLLCGYTQDNGIELRRLVVNGGEPPQLEVKVQRRVNRGVAPDGDVIKLADYS